MRKRYERVEYLNTLDPQKSCHEIHRIYSNSEFPWDYGRGLEVAVWKTCCVPEISSVLARSGHFARSGQKRYDDTRILIGEIVLHGYDSIRGRQSIRQINRAHHGFDLANEDMLYVLSAFVFEPIRWIDRWGWRKVTAAERLGSFYFFREIGKRMNISALPDDYDSFLEFNKEYERRRFRYAASNEEMSDAVLAVYSSWYRRPLDRLFAATLACRLDEAARAALGRSEPNVFARVASRTGLHAHAFAELLMPRTMARLMTRPAARSYPGYPIGYDLSDIGPAGRRIPDPPEPTAGAGAVLPMVPPHHDTVVPIGSPMPAEAPVLTGRAVVLAEPRGFCSGVERAVEIVGRAIEVYGTPVYVRREIVHNRHVVHELEERGAHFVSSVDEIPEGAVCIFSAHGVSPAVRQAAQRRRLTVIDATCPLVAKVHQEARRFAAARRIILLVGHAEHEEVEGTVGEAPGDTIVVRSAREVRELDLPVTTPVAYLTQTTLSLDDSNEVVAAIRKRFSDVVGPGSDDICYASQNRQVGIKSLARQCDVVLVVGASNSSNSLRLVEVAEKAGTTAMLVPDVEQFDERILAGVRTVGVSAGASAPEVQVQALVARLQRQGYNHVVVDRTAVEDISFGLPPGLSRGVARGTAVRSADPGKPAETDSDTRPVARDEERS
ncbi:4-hydroxy-3-methylbut-2-enyl diphosphate reductase [Nocardia sp. NPDC004568]|uniref:4-hydroxy-3-methylbut-2-enyl diphosphate reductase n=1 Tax=Nocardia sp. NPDC004568 TaxID=3154551 RepID=UPI0033A20C46